MNMSQLSASEDFQEQARMVHAMRKKRDFKERPFPASFWFLLAITESFFYLSWKVFFLEMFHSLKGSLHRFLFQIPVWSLSISNSLEERWKRSEAMRWKLWYIYLFFCGGVESARVRIVQCNTATYRNIWREDYQRIGTRHHYYSRYLGSSRQELEVEAGAQHQFIMQLWKAWCKKISSNRRRSISYYCLLSHHIHIYV